MNLIFNVCPKGGPVNLLWNNSVHKFHIRKYSVNVSDLTVLKAKRKLETGELTSEKLVTACLHNISRLEQLNAMITVCRESSILQARESDIRTQRGKRKSVLDGIPIIIKDNFCTEGVKTTAGSKMLKDFEPHFNATVVQKLLDAGAVIVGKSNMDEFGMGSGGFNSYFGPTFNPVTSEERTVSGGSSSGSSASVAADFCLAAIGSDTGGSIRLPASYCGVVGFKPTYGYVSRFGLVAYGSSLDCPGVLAKNVNDASLVLDIISGDDEKDSTTLFKNGRSLVSDIKTTLVSDIKIGVPKEYRISELSSDVLNHWKVAVNTLYEAGNPCSIVSLPNTMHSLPAYYVIALAEASSNLAKFDGLEYGHSSDEVYPFDKTRFEGFGNEVQSRILAGTFCLTKDSFKNYYLKATEIRKSLIKEFDNIFNDVDILVTPTTISTSPSEGHWRKSEEINHFSNDVFTVPASLAGLPCISVPVGLGKDRKPIGVQIIGQRGNEHLCAKIGEMLEKKV